MLERIREWTPRLGAHPFFARLATQRELEDIMAFAPASTFWVMTFQDVIRINAELTRDPVIRRHVEQHLAEDTGHEEWFLQDVESVFGTRPTNVRDLFTRRNFKVRAESFAIAAEVFRVSDDRLRLLIIEVMEAAAGVFFEHISRALVTTGNAGRLKYFAGMHLAAEADHAIHAQDTESPLASIELPPELRPEARALVDRMFATFVRHVDALHELEQDAATGA